MEIIKVKDPSFIIVTGGDSNYFQLLTDLVKSIRNTPEGKTAAIGILDGGLDQEQSKYFIEQGAKVVKPKWPSEKAYKRAKGREYLLINLNKPALDKLFPEYEIIIWLDADTWIQTWEAIDLFKIVTQKGKLAAISKASRFQKYHMNLKKRLFGWVKPKGVLFKNALKAKLPSHMCWSLVRRPVLSAGAYALRKDAPHWECWRKWQEVCIKKGRLFTSDQLSLALAVYRDELPYEALPKRCNYIGPWRFNAEKEQLVEYYAPYNPLSIIHIVNKKIITDIPDQKWAGVDMHDQPIELHLCYRSFKKNLL